jgi:hypothetical protein
VVPALSNAQLNATANDHYLAYSGDPGTSLAFTWALFSGICEVAELSNMSAQAPTAMFSSLGSFEVHLHRHEQGVGVY